LRVVVSHVQQTSSVRFDKSQARITKILQSRTQGLGELG
jgi:hypothetical protein